MKILLPAFAFTLIASGAAIAEERTVNRAAPTCVQGGQLTLAGADALASRGGSFREISEGEALQAGDRILAREGGVSIVSGGRIVASVKAGGMLAVSAKKDALCVARVSADPKIVGQGAPGGLFGGLPEIPGLGGGLTPWVVGGALAGGIAGGVAAGVSSNGNDQNQRNTVLFLLANQSH
jgi:hypothetical protein